MTLETPFPCPFCRSTWVHLVSNGRQFLHYHCEDCSEVWTAQCTPTSALVGRASSEVHPLPGPKGKVLLN